MEWRDLEVRLGGRKYIMLTMWGITVGAAVSAELGLLCFYPYWTVIGSVGSAL